MTRPIVILRPEPGNAATVARVRDAGFDPVALPLFKIFPIDWTAPAAAHFDGLLLTSANAIYQAGSGLLALSELPVLAVGAATADAARAAGFEIARTGSTDAAGLLRDAAGFSRLLWLCGQQRIAIDHPALAQAIPVYASMPIELSSTDAATLKNGVALVHSARAAAQLVREVERHAIARSVIRIAAISHGAIEAAGTGWGAVAIASAPNDAALIAIAGPLAIDP